MTANPLSSLRDYSRFVAEALGQPNVKSTTVAVWSDSPYTGIAEGEVLFANGLRLRMREEMDFSAGLIIWVHLCNCEYKCSKSMYGTRAKPTKYAPQLLIDKAQQ